MAKFSNLVANFLLATLIIIGLLSVVVINQQQNNAAEKLIDDSEFNESFQNILVNIDDSTSQAEEKYGVFNSEDPKPGFGSIVLFGIVSVGKTFSNIVFGTFTAIITLPLKVLGIPATVYNTILTLLIIIVIVAVWLLYKLGG